MKIKVAIIIQHPYRDRDIRVDIIEVEEEGLDIDQLRSDINDSLLGPFEVIAVTTKINLSANYKHLKL